MLNKWKVLPFLAVFILVSATCFADEILSLKAGYQLLSPEGTIAGTVNGEGTELDLERDLDLDDSEDFTAEITLKWGDSQLSFNYLPISFSGTGILQFDGSFNDIDFIVNDIVKTDLNIDLYDIGYTYYLLNFDDLPTRFQLGLELAVKVADVDVTFLDVTQGLVESESGTVPIPTVGVRSRIALADFLGVIGRIGYMEFDDNHFLDAEAQLEFSPLPMVGLYAGYRYFDLKIDEDDIFVETKFSGPFAGLMIRF
jgi:outer membrane protein